MTGPSAATSTSTLACPIFDKKSKRFIGAVLAFGDVFFPLFLRQ
jgi:hypothetical protein